MAPIVESGDSLGKLKRIFNDKLSLSRCVASISAAEPLPAPCGHIWAFIYRLGWSQHASSSGSVKIGSAGAKGKV